MKKAIGPKIDPSAAEQLGEFGETLNQAATLVLENFPLLYRSTLMEIRGVFSVGEVSLILDAMNGTHLVGGPIGRHLGPNIEDEIRLNQLEDKWDVDPQKLIYKVGRLTRFQSATLELWVANMWRRCDDHAHWSKEIAWLSGG